MADCRRSASEKNASSGLDDEPSDTRPDATICIVADADTSSEPEKEDDEAETEEEEEGENKAEEEEVEEETCIDGDDNGGDRA